MLYLELDDLDKDIRSLYAIHGNSRKQIIKNLIHEGKLKKQKELSKTET
jgi:hypothetical protein